MRKIFVSFGIGALVIIIGGSITWWYISQKSIATQDVSAQPGSIPLSQDNSSGSNSQGTNQVNLQSNLGGSNSNSSSNSNSNLSGNAQNSTSTNSGSQEPSPSDFAQYNKYSTSQNALFGDVTLGSGQTAVAGSQVTINYKGWLTSGQLFDQNDTSSPLVFTIGKHEVVTGMEEGVLGMKTGGKRLVIIPPAVGYGATAHGSIPANSVLVFEVDLITVN